MWVEIVDPQGQRPLWGQQVLVLDRGAGQVQVPDRLQRLARPVADPGDRAVQQTVCRGRLDGPRAFTRSTTMSHKTRCVSEDTPCGTVSQRAVPVSRLRHRHDRRSP